jgi:hypothetical protein
MILLALGHGTGAPMEDSAVDHHGRRREDGHSSSAFSGPCLSVGRSEARELVRDARDLT